VIVSSSESPSDINRAYELGANAYMVKPVDYRAVEHLFQSITQYWAWSALNGIGIGLRLRPTKKKRRNTAHSKRFRAVRVPFALLFPSGTFASLDVCPTLKRVLPK